MVEVIMCSRCGFIFHKGGELLPPHEVVKRFNYKCPSCYKEISVNSAKISVVNSNSKSV